MKIPILTILTTAILLFSNCKTAKINSSQTAKSPVRGVWLTNVVSDALSTKESLKAAVKLCSENGINTIFMVAWNRGRTLYPSKIMQDFIGISMDEKYVGRDPLREVIDEAKKYNIQVIAWFEFGFSCDLEEKAGIIEGKEILQKKPRWAALDKSGKVVSKNGFRWLNGFDHEVQDFMLSLLVEAVKKYPDLAGIQGDDRLPAMPSEAGYDPLSISLFAKENGGQMPPDDPKNPAWLTWRANKMSDFMKRIHDTLKALKPSIIISMSPSIYPWAKEEYLQDWPRWVREGWVDMVCPQVYRYNIERYRGELDAMLGDQIPKDKQNIIAPGVLLRLGDYYPPIEFLELMIAENRKRGIQGEVFFYFEGLKKFPDFFKKLYR